MASAAQAPSAGRAGAGAHERRTPAGPVLRMVGLGLLLWFAGRAAVSAWQAVHELASTPRAVWSEALTSSEEERIVAELLRRDRSGGLPDGYHLGLYLALRAAVPPDGRVFFIKDEGTRAANVALRLHVLLYPRFLRRVPLSRRIEGELDELTFAVTFEGHVPRGLDRVAQPIDRGEDWVLWRCGGKP